MDWQLVGYLLSSLSVLMLGGAAWHGTPDHWRPILLISGMATSVVGMMCRYVSHRQDEAAIASARREARAADIAAQHADDIVS